MRTIALFLLLCAPASADAPTERTRDMQLRFVVTDPAALETACRNLLRKEALPAAEIRRFVVPAEGEPPDLERCLDHLLLDRVRQISGVEFSDLTVIRFPERP